MLKCGCIVDLRGGACTPEPGAFEERGSYCPRGRGLLL